MPDTESALRAWYETPAGQRVAACERAVLGPLLRRCANVRLLQVGSHPDGFPDSDTGHAARWLATQGGSPDSQLRSHAAALPLVDGSMHTVLLLHALEFADSPHAVLREAVRVLAPEGHLLIVVFNPLSLFGMHRALLGCWRADAPWSGHYYGGHRLRDWCRLLELEPVCVRATAFAAPSRLRLPGRTAARLEQFCQSRLRGIGGVRIILARKRLPRRLPPRGPAIPVPRLRTGTAGLARRGGVTAAFEPANDEQPGVRRDAHTDD
ncbi:class I SAM-dependent methyltransferase [Methylonatrum kenyense]|uniref:class I SAM-dependent methyltransferase n=1 Tax=Methylonatrum kenyense TaxID=455253 RepID=UPI0020BF7606|nr:methyltransferase domain-containing protein [Methylonatrum kenyense]MCK8515115.1 class I SAM-dependent methyltransferase [Methylonatrum kenyense]